MGAGRERGLPRRVLLVEDDVDVAAGIGDLLTSYGYEVAAEHTGAGAEAAVAAFQPDVLVLDVRLPDADGTKLFHQLRERWPALGVVFSSGHLRDLAEVGGDTSRGVVLLQKPYDGASLVAAVETVFRSSRGR